MLSDELVGDWVALVQDDEEEIESAHDGRADRHVGLEGLGAVVPAEHGIGGGQDAGTRVQRGLDACGEKGRGEE